MTSVMGIQQKVVGNLQRLNRAQTPQVRFGNDGGGDLVTLGKGELVGFPDKADFEKQLNRYKADNVKPNRLGKLFKSAIKLPISVPVAIGMLPVYLFLSPYGITLLNPKNTVKYFSHSNDMLDGMLKDRRRNQIFDLTFDKPRELVEKGQVKEAFGQFTKALKKEPLNPWTYLGMGDFAANIIADLKGVINRGRFPNFTLTDDGKKQLREANINYKGIALEAYDRADQIVEAQALDKSIPDYQGKGVTTVWNKANLYELLDDKEKTIEFRKKAISEERRKNGNVSTAQEALIRSYEHFGDTEKAMEESVALAKKGQTHYFEYLVRTQAEAKAPEGTDKKAAGSEAVINALANLIEAKPSDRSLMEHYAELCQWNKKPEKAIQAYENLLDREMNLSEPNGREIKRLTNLIKKLKSPKTEG